MSRHSVLSIVVVVVVVVGDVATREKGAETQGDEGDKSFKKRFMSHL